MNIKIVVVCLLSTMVFTGCGTKFIKKASTSDSTGWYTERLEKDILRVQFKAGLISLGGGGKNLYQGVRLAAYLKAAEETTNNGYKYFFVIEEEDGDKSGITLKSSMKVKYFNDYPAEVHANWVINAEQFIKAHPIRRNERVGNKFWAPSVSEIYSYPSGARISTVNSALRYLSGYPFGLKFDEYSEIYHTGGNIQISSIDGIKIYNWEVFGFFLILTPGTHIMDIKYYSERDGMIFSAEKNSYRFTVEKGKKYYMESKIKKGIWTLEFGPLNPNDGASR
ncbi:MAG: hypothetical protein IPN19_00990 [Elusimicrobia bacterium]|nr:hypothetical protein [Elusimicrobiota bacterium]